MTEYRYTVKTDSMDGTGYVVVRSDNAKSVIEYAKEYTANRPLMHLRLYEGDRALAVVINGKAYVEVTENVLYNLLMEGGER